MNAPELISVGGVLYRARVEKQAAQPHVQSHAGNAIVALLRILHDAGVGEGTVDQLVALREAITAKNYPIAARLWSSIQPSVLSSVEQLEGSARDQFGRAALDLDEHLTNLAKTAAAQELPLYLTVGDALYRRRK